ncbi:MAG: NusA-like transcription termination signal-binding factor [Candidatus Altiarchaeota archaeon]|nr:NusA-like transcription termination signal-binding factor [Candidatus Altiarchaeota archaeon]
MRLNTQDLRYMNAFEKLTGACVVECFEAEGALNFIVQEGSLGMAIGKKGSNITKVKSAIGKRVMVYEDGKDIDSFLKKLCSPMSPRITRGEGSLKVELPKRDRDDMPGRRIRIIKELVKRRFDIPEVNFVFV